MIPAFTLTRSIPIHVTRFAGEVAQEEERPELMPFLLMARDHGAITARDAAGHLLGAAQGREQIARRLLETLERTGAMARRQDGKTWALTEAGREALEKEEVFIAERGDWEVWHADDPLLPHGLIHLAVAEEPRAGEETRRDAPQRRASPPHATLDALKGLPLAPIMGGARRRIDELPDQVEPREGKTAQLIWDVAARRLALKLDGRSCDLPAPVLSHAETFDALLEAADLASRWDSDREVLRRAFPDLSDAARRSMIEDVDFAGRSGRRSIRPGQLAEDLPGPIPVPGCGAFDPTTVRGVSICASTQAHAEDWATWRLLDAMDDIASARRFAAWREQASESFAEFAPLALPGRAELAARALPRIAGEPLSAAAWNLNAAEDWSL